IKSHLADFEAKLKASKNTADYVKETVTKIRSICEHEGFETVADISADGLNRFTNHWLDQGNSARSAHSYIAKIKSFTAWLVKHDKLGRDPLASVVAPNHKADRRY